MNLRALIIEDEKLVSWSLQEHLKKIGFEITITEYGGQGVTHALQDPPDVLFVDFRLPDMNGIDILRELQGIRNETVFFFMTAYGTDKVAVEAMRLGAFRYLNKPVNFDEVTVLIEMAFKEREKSQKISILEHRGDQEIRLGSYVSHSPRMREVMSTIRKLRQTDTGTILLLGETGTGKDMLARLVHEHGLRQNKPFVIVNCASLSEHLLESELFGYEKGAFTDAKARKHGQIELADGGSVYLDEIGEIPIGFQAKLLRFIETQSFYRVGGVRELKVNVRIIASTNRDLRQEMESGTFREDLYFRLNVISLTIPPLRERLEDVSDLTSKFIERFNSELNLHVTGIDKAAQDMLNRYDWPGNIRELKNTLERIFLLEKPERISVWHLPQHIQNHFRNGAPVVDHAILDEYFKGKTWSEIENEIVAWALQRENNNQSRAARLLGLTRDQIRYKMKKYNLT
ncbi:MAG: sigma-54 dependent transcriptional regulator [Candidatus Neomarinimicrobiota bacterium]